MQSLEDNKYINKVSDFFGSLFSLKKSQERRLSFEFAFLTSGVIVIIVLCMGLYINSAMNRLNEKAVAQSEALNVSLSATILGMISEDIDKHNFSNLSSKLSHMLSNKVLAYLIIENNKTKKIVYSTLPYNSVYIDNNELRTMDITDSSMKKSNCIRGSRKNYNIYVGFYSDETFKTYFNLLIKQLAALIFAFILMGLLLSHFLSKKVINPLNSLIQSTSEFKTGDLSNRVAETDYKEINELVASYNSMADALQGLYSSLEHKVQDRTRQLEEAYAELQNTQAMMVHSEKMKSLGELVAGIMHEINNPINFIYGNLSHLDNYSSDLIGIIEKYAKYESDFAPEHKSDIEKHKKEIDYEFLKTDLPDLIRSCKEGTERTKNIILDLKNFSRLEEIALTDVDLPKEIDTTLNILHNKFKNRIEVHKEYQENLPKLEAFGGQINQVFMNILDNACYAIKDKGDVWIRIKTLDKNVIIEFEDNGSGMDQVTLAKIFNPFFTTKPVGQGTGMGMAISYKVIKNHEGAINVESELNKGTKFTITLPINHVRKNDKQDGNISGNEEEIVV